MQIKPEITVINYLIFEDVLQTLRQLRKIQYLINKNTGIDKRNFLKLVNLFSISIIRNRGKKKNNKL